MCRFCIKGYAMKRFNIKDRMIRSIAMRKGEVVLRSDFDALGSSSQISRALRELIDAGRLVRIGYGVYAKAKKSCITGRPVPREPLELLALEALTRLKVDAKAGKAQDEYVIGNTAQIPMQATFNTGERRISRKFTVGSRVTRYENNYRS